jgi:hypothetical protein
MKSPIRFGRLRNCAALASASCPSVTRILCAWFAYRARPLTPGTLPEHGPRARDGRVTWQLTPDDKRPHAGTAPRSGGPAVRRSTQSNRGNQDGLEGHDERAAVIVDCLADGFDQPVSNRWFEGRVVAP